MCVRACVRACVRVCVCKGKTETLHNAHVINIIEYNEGATGAERSKVNGRMSKVKAMQRRTWWIYDELQTRRVHRHLADRSRTSTFRTNFTTMRINAILIIIPFPSATLHSCVANTCSVTFFI